MVGSIQAPKDAKRFCLSVGCASTLGAVTLRSSCSSLSPLSVWEY